MAAKPRCACGNPACKVAKLAARVQSWDEELAALSGERVRLLTDTKPDYKQVIALDKLGTRVQRATGFQQHAKADHAVALNECTRRQALLTVGAQCPLCRRTVAPWGATDAEAAAANLCLIAGPFWWRGGVAWPPVVGDSEQRCKYLAWVRLRA